MKSWKTSIAGIGALVAAIGSALKAQFDADPNTVPDWNLVVTCGIVCWGFLQARDKNVSTEEQLGK